MSHLIWLSIPGLRHCDLAHMPHLAKLFATGESAAMHHTFPAVTWPAQTTMLTGKSPQEHGVVANGMFHRDRGEVEMWTAGNEIITAPQIWDQLKQRSPDFRSAVWFPMLAKRCTADYACMPAPVHNPDGSESLWCYSNPPELYGLLRERLGHFPLMNFWGPMANVDSTKWILNSALIAIQEFRPHLTFVYVPHLDYATQRAGADSPAAKAALIELDGVVSGFAQGVSERLGANHVAWLATSEYVIVDVDHVLYPNRILRDAGLLNVIESEDGEQLDLVGSQAWAMVDHQFSHIFVRSSDKIQQVVELFHDRSGVATVVAGRDRAQLNLDHPRSGEVVVESTSNSWQAYYWWLDDRRAPAFARTVDIHRKPGYDPVELFWDRTAQGVPLDASLVRGSHGARGPSHHGICLASRGGFIGAATITDRQIASLVSRHFQRETWP